MAVPIETPETKGHDRTNLETGKGVLEREIEALYGRADPDQPQLFRMTARLPKKGRGATLLAATAPASVAAFTAPTSPLTMVETSPPPALT